LDSRLATLHFLSDAKNIVFIGPPGVGKTHLAVALGLKAAMARKRVLFLTAEDIINELSAAEVSNSLQSFLDSLSRLDLLIIDELGYLNVSKQSAALFFKLISKRYESTSTIITSNRAFEQWGEVFSDDVVAAAILDRILHHCYPFLIQGGSYRLKEIIGKKMD
jgi:DNA replication protein DnaC